MRVLSLLGGADLVKIPYYIGACLGAGADGEIREMPSYPNKVLKLSIIYDLDYSKNLFAKYKKISDLYFALKKDNHPSLVRLYEHGLVHTGERVTALGKQDYLIHYCVMEKLFKISEDEEKVFHTILSHEDSDKVKNYSDDSLKEILFNLRRGLDFSEKEVKLFCTNLRSMKYKHNDIHVRNIMKTRLGKFKLIDFDRME